MIPFHKPSRRDVLVAAGAMTASSALRRPSQLATSRERQEGTPPPGKLLILGGTRFLGPVIVRAALKAGWEVTLFNRGKSNPKLFTDLDLRVGDRNTSDYSSLATGRWDLVIDTSCYIPGHVTAAIAALGDRAGHYLVVSTLSVYSEPKKESGSRNLDESSEVADIDPELLPEFREISDVGKYGSRYYGALKALCEQAAEAAMPGQVTVVRPGLIVGPEDGSDRFTYWPVRIAEGGRILAPGDPEALVQYVDVRDLGAFTFDVGARRVSRVINAVGFDGPVTTRQMLESCIAEGESSNPARFVWVDDDFLLAQQVAPWMGLPLWIPGSRTAYSNALARKEGLRFRPLAETASATLTWHRETRDADHRWRAGITRQKEAEVLAAWDGR